MKRKPKHDIAEMLPGLCAMVVEAHSRIGDWVLYMRNGTMFMRVYTPPANPRMEKQQAHRNRMSRAMLVWANMDSRVGKYWYAEADNYNRAGRERP